MASDLMGRKRGPQNNRTQGACAGRLQTSAGEYADLT